MATTPALSPAPLTDAEKLDHLILAAERARGAAKAGKLYASWQGIALFNAMNDLTGCDALYDIAKDIGWTMGVNVDGSAIDFMQRRDAA